MCWWQQQWPALFVWACGVGCWSCAADEGPAACCDIPVLILWWAFDAAVCVPFDAFSLGGLCAVMTRWQGFRGLTVGTGLVV